MDFVTIIQHIVNITIQGQNSPQWHILGAPHVKPIPNEFLYWVSGK